MALCHCRIPGRFLAGRRPVETVWKNQVPGGRGFPPADECIEMGQDKSGHTRIFPVGDSGQRGGGGIDGIELFAQGQWIHGQGNTIALGNNAGQQVIGGGLEMAGAGWLPEMIEALVAWLDFRGRPAGFRYFVGKIQRTFNKTNRSRHCGEQGNC